MEVSEAIRQRRSVRAYKGEKVGIEKVQKILEAGRWAPSGLNNQPWKFKVLTGEEKKCIVEYTKYGHVIGAADLCICVFLDEASTYNRDKDLQAVGACIQNMLLSIHDLGLGGVWLGEILNQKEEVQKVLGVEDELMAVIALGTPDQVGSSQRKKLEQLMC